MNKWRLQLAMGLVLGLAPLAFASSIPFDPAPDPANGATWAQHNDPDPGDIPNVIVQNSTGPVQNPNGTNYWFAASDTQNQPLYSNGGITDTVNGKTQIGSAPSPAPGQSFNETFPGLVDHVLAGDTYYVYAQACNNGVGIVANTAGQCSDWIRLASVPVFTKYLPTAPFITPVRADVNTNSIVVNANVSDPSDVQDWNLGLNNVQVGTVTVFGQSLRGYSTTQKITIGPGGGYDFTLAPNNRYLYLGQVEYFWSQPAPASPEIENFTTTPVQPGASSIGTVTHCSAQIITKNSTGLPANPTYTTYQDCLNLGAGCQMGAINGSGQPNDTVTLTFTDLTAGTTYSGTSQALNEDARWSNSATNVVPGFFTNMWGGTFNVTGVWITSATIDIENVNLNGITSWQIKNGAQVLQSGDQTNLIGVHTLTGLTSNTIFTTTVVLTENNGSCSSTLPTVPPVWTTTPYAPTSFAMVANSPTQISGSWLDSLNPNYTTYQVLLCQNAQMTPPCSTTDVGHSTWTALTGLTPEIQYWGEVNAQSHGNGSDSAYSNQATATTPNQAPVIGNLVCGPVVNNSDGCQGTQITDNGLISQLKCTWSGSDTSGDIVSFNPTTQVATGTLSGTCGTTASYPASGVYTVTLTVQDHLGGVGSLQTQRQVFVSVNAIGSTVIIQPSSATLVAGNNQLFTAIVLDQTGQQIPGQQVIWSATGGTLQGSNPAPSITYHAVTPGSWGITATTGTVHTTAPITILGAGPFFTTNPFVTLNPDGKTALLTAAAFDNDGGFDPNTLSYNWSIFSGPPQTTISLNPTVTFGTSTVSTATFSKAGTYVLQCLIQDPFGSATSTAPAVTLAQVLTAITVTPTNITIQSFQNQQFSANEFDQFAMAMTNPLSVNWSTSGGNISGSGQFNSPSLGSNFRVTASHNNISGSAFVTVVSFDVSGSYAYPVPFKSTENQSITFTGLGSEAKIRVYTIKSRLVFNTETTAGTYSWDTKNNSGEKVASGVYFYVIESPAGKKDGKLIIIQ